MKFAPLAQVMHTAGARPQHRTLRQVAEQLDGDLDVAGILDAILTTGWTDAAQGRLERLQAKMRTHDDAVKKLTADTPKLQEYRERWASFQKEVAALDERVKSVFSVMNTTELDPLELRYNNLLTEWEILDRQSILAKQAEGIKAAEQAIKDQAAGKQPSASDLKAAAQGKYPVSDMPASQAAPVAAPPPPPSSPGFSSYILPAAGVVAVVAAAFGIKKLL